MDRTIARVCIKYIPSQPVLPLALNNAPGHLSSCYCCHLDPSSPSQSKMEDATYEVQSQMELVIESPISVPKSPKSITDLNLSQRKIKGKIQKRSSKPASGRRPTTSVTKSASMRSKTELKPTLKDQKMHRMVFQEGGLPDGSTLSYMCLGKTLLEGYKMGHGIHCYCCDSVISPSQFEAHAGQASRKRPYGNIFVSNGVSLHAYATHLKQNGEHLPIKNDDICRVCHKGGDLFPCHGCPRSFHRGCVSEKTIPQNKWFCKYCRNSMRYKDSKANSIAAGRVLGVDPMKQIANRCIRIVEKSDKCDIVACSLCRSFDFSESGFNDRTVIVCDQCEKEYHVGCLKEHNKADLKELPAGDWFCTVDCGRLHSVLKNLVTSGPEKVPDCLMEIIKNKLKDSDLDTLTDLDVKWIVLHGKDASEESRLMLAEAVDIFHESFNPIIDSVTGSDFIPSMVYGQQMGDSDFVGVHIALLTINSKVVTAAMFRVFGKDMAEIPIVATSRPSQGKGYFQVFFTCFEKLIAFLNVKKILVPAAEEVISMWVNKLQFNKITPKEVGEYRQTQPSMVVFEGTELLEKDIIQSQITYEDGVNFSLSMG